MQIAERQSFILAYSFLVFLHMFWNSEYATLGLNMKRIIELFVKNLCCRDFLSVQAMHQNKIKITLLEINAFSSELVKTQNYKIAQIKFIS